MSVNHDTYKLSSLLSDDLKNFNQQTHNKNWLTLYNSENIWPSKCDNLIDYNLDNRCETASCSSTVANWNKSLPKEDFCPLQQSNLFEGINTIYSLQNTNPSNCSTHNNINGSIVDYSLYPSVNEQKATSLISTGLSALPPSNYCSNSVQSVNYQNMHEISVSSSIFRRIYKPTDCSTNTVTSDGRLLKRRYTKNPLNVSRRYGGKYLRKENDDNNKEFSHCKVQNTDKSVTKKDSKYSAPQADSTCQLTTNTLLNETYPLTKDITQQNKNSLARRNFDIDNYVKDRNCDKVTSSTSMSARSKRNTKIEDEDAANTVKCDNTDVKKDVTVTGAAYKYLTWREKDRRRRFREEWKHLWLVIPHGLYEVMCLVCHKVMTQRKVDTIKRHTVRRHAELLGMSQVERENLFNELMRRFNMQEVTKYNSSTYTPSKSPKKLNEPCDSTFLRNPHGFSNVNELNGVSKNCLLNTSICLDGRISELHNIGTVSTSSNCLIGNSLNFQPLLNARNKNSHSRHIQSVKPTRRCAINSFPYGNKFLPRTPQNEDTIENLNNLPSKPVTNRYNSLEFITNSFASETSLPKTSNNFHNPSDYFIFGNKIKSPTLNSKSIPTDHSLLTPMIPPLLPISLEFPVSTSFAASTSGTQSVNNFNSHGSMCFQSLPSSNPSKLSSSFQLLESFPIFRNLNKLSTLSQHNNNPMNCNNGGIGFNSNNADNNSPSVEDHENFHFDSPVKQNVVNNQNNLFNLKLGSAATADINNTSVSSYVNDRHANTQQSTSSDVSHNSRCTSFSSSCSHNVPNLTTSPSLQLMMNYLVTALANTSKTLNQEVYDMAFENLAKIVSNISSNTEKTCIFPTHLLNPNLMKNYSTDLNTCHKDGIPTSKREETVTNLSNQTHFQQFHQPQSSKDYNTKNKSSPHCNKFTISSLLNTDDHLTLKRTVKAATRVNQLSPDIPKKNEISQTVKHINSSLQYDYEKSNVEQISPCTSYLLCNLKSGNTDPYELNTKFSSSNLNQNNTHIFHNDSFDNEKEKRSFLTNLFDPPKTFDSNKISEQNSNLNETYQMYKDIFEGNSHSNGQIQLSSFLNPNILQSQDVGTFEAYMKFFYLELLRQHYDNIPKINHSTNTGSRSEPSPASEGSIRTNVITYSDEHNKSSVND